MRPNSLFQIRYFPYAYKLMIPFLLLLLLTDAVIGYYSYTSSIRSLTVNNNVNMTRILEQIRDNTVQQLKVYEKVSEQIYDDINIQRNLLVRQFDYETHDWMDSYLLPTLDTAIKLPVNDIILSLYVRNENVNEVYPFTEPEDNPFSLLSHYNIFHLKRVEREDWYESFMEDKPIMSWRQIGSDGQYGNITLLRRLISFDQFSTIGLITVKARLRDLFKSVDSFELTEGVNVLVVGSGDHSILYSRTPNAAGRFDPAAAGTSHLVIEEALPGTPWKLVALMPRSELRKAAGEIQRVTVLVCAASFVVAALIGIFVSRFFSARVRNIVAMARSFQNGEFRSRIAAEGNDEFVFVSRAINRMADDIEELIRQVYVKNINIKEAELNALQAQINPHFLYNTLSSINSMAKLGEVDKLTDMVSGLAQFYRLTLSDGSRLIPLSREIEQVQTYADIQQVKHGERFSFLCDVEPDILHFDTIKLILQPFVENALKHAWYEGRITIKVVGFREGTDIVLKVIDDGVGFSPEEWARRPHDPDRSGGYGIRNVDERIKLQFGPGYGVSLFSRIGIGTTVKIVIPQYTHSESDAARR